MARNGRSSDDEVGFYAYGVPPFARPDDGTQGAGCLGCAGLLFVGMTLILVFMARP